MKYSGAAASAPPLPPPIYSAFPAVKYNSAEKYGRVLAQYVHPVMNPANGPKACLHQTYMPPSSGYSVERCTTTIAKGANMAKPPRIHTISEDGPTPAAAAIHCRLEPVTIKKSATSHSPKLRRRSRTLP